MNNLLPGSKKPVPYMGETGAFLRTISDVKRFDISFSHVLLENDRSQQGAHEDPDVYP